MKVTEIAVIGAGYVGESLIAQLSSLRDFRVTAVDISKSALAKIRASFVDVTTLTSDEARELPNHFDVVIIAVPTPLAAGEPDLSYVARASSLAVDIIRPAGVISLESTVGLGDTKRVLGSSIDERAAVDGEFSPSYGYSPERVNPGDDQHTLRTVPKIVSGFDAKSTSKMIELYEQIVDQVVPASSIEEAELAKLLENTFRLVNIALVNQISFAAKKAGVDPREVVRLASTKPFGFMPFFPSIGAGGHCIPVDPVFLEKGISGFGEQTIVEAALLANISHPKNLATQLISEIQSESFSDREITSILCYGLSYKPNVSDTRNSAALQIVQYLESFSGLDLYAYDPRVEKSDLPDDLSRVKMAPVDKNVDFVIKLVDHDEWKDDSQKLRCSKIIFLP